jgi:hypothetical protein
VANVHELGGLLLLLLCKDSTKICPKIEEFEKEFFLK